MRVCLGGASHTVTAVIVPGSQTVALTVHVKVLVLNIIPLYRLELSAVVAAAAAAAAAAAN